MMTCCVWVVWCRQSAMNHHMVMMPGGGAQQPPALAPQGQQGGGLPVEHRIQLLVAQLLGEREGFYKMVKMLERYKARSPPDAQALVEIRSIMMAALQVTKKLETECARCMEALKGTAGEQFSQSGDEHSGSFDGQGALTANGEGRGGGGSSGGQKRKYEAISPTNAKPVKLPHVHRSPEAGDQAAACVDGGDWILTRVVNFNDITEHVTVVDEDDVRQRQYILRRDLVMLLPRVAFKETQARFYPRGSKALALYPGSTALYPAVVVDNSIKKDGGQAFCQMQFEDDEGDHGEVRTQEVLLRMITEIPPQLLDP